ncbi:hypothetical protein ABPG72_012847 [Tetrahymena utriculariae]
MDNLREEDKRTLELLFLKAKQLDEELEHEADIEDYREMQAFFNQDEEQNKKILQQKQQMQGIETEEDLTKEQLEEQNQIIEEIQRELSQDELFTPDNQQQVSDEQKLQQKKCFICKTKDHKYTCPGCLKKTCSLQCSKDHKVQFNCSGKPNYTGFVDKNSYSEATAKKDYQYLKQTLEGTEYIRKKLSFVNHNPELLRLKLLKIYARKKHKIDLVFAPTIMKRHRENISFYYMKNKLIYWLLEVQIVYFQKQSLGLTENNVLIADQQGGEENVKLQEKNIRKLVDPIPENIFWSHVLKSGETNLFDDELLLKENVDFSSEGVLKQLENKELSIFIKNRYRIIDIVETKTKDNLNQQWSFQVPQSYLEIQIPNEYRERENINKQFQSEYQMVEIHPDTFIYNTLHGAKINEFPEIFLVNKKYLQPFTEKYKCLLCTSDLHLNKLQKIQESQTIPLVYIEEISIFYCPIKEKGNILKGKKCGFKCGSEWFSFLEESLYLFQIGSASLYFKKKQVENSDANDYFKILQNNEPTQDNLLSDESKMYEKLIAFYQIFQKIKFDSAYNSMMVFQVYTDLRQQGKFAKRASQELEIKQILNCINKGQKQLHCQIQDSENEILTKINNLTLSVPIFTIFNSQNEFQAQSCSYYLMIKDVNSSNLTGEDYTKINNLAQKIKLKMAIVDNSSISIIEFHHVS